MDFFAKPEIIWLIAGILLLLLEFAIPGVLVIFFGFGALVTALLTYLTGMCAWMQFISFVIFSMLFVFLLRNKFLSMLSGNKDVDPEEEFVGYKGTVGSDMPASQIVRIDFRGTQWNAISETPIAKGQRFVIIGKDGLTLKIKPVD
jgi:membrane protein implicated in regulation of membrane protease activity